MEKTKVFNLVKKRMKTLTCLLLVVAIVIGLINVPALAAYTATTLNLSNDTSLSFDSGNYKISKTDLVNYIQNLPDEQIKTNDLGIDKSTFDLSQIDDIRFDYKFNSLFEGVSTLNNDTTNAYYSDFSSYYENYYVFRFLDFTSSNYYYDSVYFTTYNEMTKSLGDINFYTDENGKKILAFDLYWEYEELNLNTDKVLFTFDTYNNKNLKIKKSDFLTLYNKYSDIPISIDDISTCSIHLYQDKGNPVGIRKVDAIIGDDEYFYFDLGCDIDYSGNGYKDSFKPARIVGTYSNIKPIINNYPDGNGKYEINLHFTYLENTNDIQDFIGQEINGTLNLVNDKGKTIEGNKLTILETDNLYYNFGEFNYDTVDNKKTKILIKHNGEVINTIEPMSTDYSYEFLLDGTKSYFGIVGLDGASCGEETVVLALPSTYDEYTYAGYEIKNEENQWGYNQKVYYLNFDVKTNHQYDEPTSTWTNNTCDFTFDCNYTDSDCTKNEVIPGVVAVKEKKEPTCDEDGYVIYEATCDTTNHDFEDGVHNCTTNHIHTSISDPITLPKTGHTAGEAKKENEVNPTCVDDGSYDLVTRCTKCNEIMSSEHKIVPALGHTWDDNDWELVNEENVTDDLLNNAENTVTLTPKCKVYKRICSRYQDAYELLVIPHKHDLGDITRENEVDPDCVHDGGYDLVVRCKDCNEELSRDHYVLPALGHIWHEDDWEEVKSSDITDELLQNAENNVTLTTGCKLYKHICDRYQDAYELKVEPHKHTPGDVQKENEKDPTCLKDGGYDLVVRCTECNEILSSNHFVIPALGHKWKDDDWKLVDDADVTDELLENAENSDSLQYEDNCKVYKHKCSRYQDAYELLIIPHGHVLGDITRENEKDPTCTKEGGYDLVVRCKDCNEELSRDHYVLPALGHIWHEEDWEEVNAADVTDELLSKADNANSLQYKPGSTVYKRICSRYQDAYELLISPHVHEAGDATRENEINPTCVKTGGYDLVVRCKTCNEILSSNHYDLPALGHTWDDNDWELVKASDVTDELLKNAINKDTIKYVDKCTVYKHICTRYQDAYELLIVPHEHTPGDCVIENNVDPTCTKDGGYDKVYYCKDCGDELQRDHVVVPKLGHEFGEWYETKTPTYDECGTKQRDCIRKDYSETAEIDKKAIDATISGYVKNSDGKPLKDVNVRLSDGKVVTTNENGYFEFKNVTNGSYTVSIITYDSSSLIKVDIKTPSSTVEKLVDMNCNTVYTVSTFDVTIDMTTNAKAPEEPADDNTEEDIDKPATKKKTNKPTKAKTSKVPYASSNPKTGDTNPISAYILILLLSATGIIVSIKKKES